MAAVIARDSWAEMRSKRSLLNSEMSDLKREMGDDVRLVLDP